jgi:cytochrome c-type biogenesis protein CcsB
LGAPAAMETLFGLHPLAGVTTVLFGVTLPIAAWASISRRRGWLLAGLALLAVAFLANTAVIAERWIEAGRPPFKTRFETLLLYPWCVAAVTLILIGLHRLYVLVPCAAAAAVLCLGYALAHPDLETVLLMPALQSGWFVPHVVTYFVAYAALFASCALAGLALAAPLWRRSAAVPAAYSVWTPDTLATHAHKAAAFGVVALTFGLVMGAVWAKFAWGDYWTWDPKENWSLITWLAYVTYLHLRLAPGWQGRRAAWLLVASFGAVLFTWLGMHLLPTAEGSLHVYQ